MQGGLTPPYSEIAMINQGNHNHVTEAANRLISVEDPDQLASQMTDFICQVLGTVVLDGVVRVTDLAGKAVSAKNNYLLSENGKEFQGVLTSANGQVSKFTIFEKSPNMWTVELSRDLVP